MKKMIDVSYHNGKIKWEKVEKAGYHAIIRCGYGQETESQHDKKWLENVRGCTENGIPYGVYIYSYASTSSGARGEARHLLSQIEDAVSRGYNAPSYPVFIDLEESKYRTSAVVVASAFLDEIAADGMYDGGIYASLDWWNNTLSSFKTDDVCKWVARWNDDESARPSFCDIWQYTSDGTISGISGRVDLNWCYIDVNGSVSASKPSSNGNSDIKAVQKWCNSNYGQSLDVDGIDGHKTLKSLVKVLQTELNEQFGKTLSIDGIFGTSTYNACVNVKPGARGNLTKVIQGRLICLGYDTGGFDGIYGDCTENAIKDVQRKNKLSVDGICGKNTCRILFS